MATRTRRLRPREPIATAPSHVSQLTCMALVGIDPRRFLELLTAHPEVPRAAVGRLRVVALDDLRGLLARLAATSDSTTETETDTDDDDDQPSDADSVLRAIGMRRAS